MSGRFLHEGITRHGHRLDYDSLKSQLTRSEVIVATWLTNQRSRVRVISNEKEFLALIEEAANNPEFYHLRFFGSLQYGNSYFDYNPSKNPKFVDRSTPHWKAMAAYDTARFTIRPDDILVLTRTRQLCIPACESFTIRLEFDRWLEIVPGVLMRRVRDHSDQLKYRVLDERNRQLEIGDTTETADWVNFTPVMQLRRSPTDPLATEFRYRG